MDCWRVKRSLIISIVGMRPRMIRSWLVRLYGLIPWVFILFRGRLDLAGHDSAHQGIDFFLREYLVHAILGETRSATG